MILLSAVLLIGFQFHQVQQQQQQEEEEEVKHIIISSSSSSSRNEEKDHMLFDEKDSKTIESVVSRNPPTGSHNTSEQLTKKKKMMNPIRFVSDMDHENMDCFTAMQDVFFPKETQHLYNSYGDSSKKMPLPVIQLGFPKAGTTSINDVFKKSGYKTIHFVDCLVYAKLSKARRGLCAECMRIAHMLGRPLLKSCDKSLLTENRRIEVWTQLDACSIGPKKECVFPQIDYLDDIHAEVPNATFLMNMRNVTKWISSVSRWNDLRERLTENNLPDLPSGSATDEELTRFYCNQVRRVRKFVVENPSHAYIELDVESADAGQFLASVFGTQADHWGASNQNLDKKT